MKAITVFLKKIHIPILLLFMCCGIATTIHAQTDSLAVTTTINEVVISSNDTIQPAPILLAGDTIAVSVRKKNPKIATWLSAVVPGAGQFYNGKVWKIPIIYGAFATTLYLINDFDKRYKFYREQYDVQTDSYMKERAKQGMSYYRRYRDLNYLITVAIYTLNIIDANVDAHFASFDISDDISMNIRPLLITDPKFTTLGMSYTFNF
ncbi:MAG: hypothetical protein RIS47_1101 [Bacteroidota bacterium]